MSLQTISLEQVEEQLRAIELQKQKVVADAKFELVQLEAAEYALQILLLPIRQAQLVQAVEDHRALTEPLTKLGTR